MIIFFLNIDLSCSLVFLDVRISSDKMLCFLLVKEIFVRQDHFGGGVDFKVKTACINDKWVGPSWLS